MDADDAGDRAVVGHAGSEHAAEERQAAHPAGDQAASGIGDAAAEIEQNAVVGPAGDRAAVGDDARGSGDPDALKAADDLASGAVADRAAGTEIDAGARVALRAIAADTAMVDHGPSAAENFDAGLRCVDGCPGGGGGAVGDRATRPERDAPASIAEAHDGAEIDNAVVGSASDEDARATAPGDARGGAALGAVDHSAAVVQCDAGAGPLLGAGDGAEIRDLAAGTGDIHAKVDSADVAGCAVLDRAAGLHEHTHAVGPGGGDRAVVGHGARPADENALPGRLGQRGRMGGVAIVHRAGPGNADGRCRRFHRAEIADVPCGAAGAIQAEQVPRENAGTRRNRHRVVGCHSQLHALCERAGDDSCHWRRTPWRNTRTARGPLGKFGRFLDGPK